MDRVFTAIATRVASLAGQPLAFVLAAFSIILWAVSGPIFGFSDTWQLIVNTATTVLTFLMVFVIQNSQNRDAAAMQAKLDELLRALDKAREQFVGIEHLTEPEIIAIRKALEKEVRQASGKDATANDTVERLIERR